MKLYYVPKTRAFRVRWLLEELSVPYELVRMEPRDTKAPAYLAIHPKGHVPALVDGDTTLFESAAICLYLADRFPEKRLAPPPASAARGAYYQWICFALTELEPHCAAVHAHTVKLPEAERVPAAAESAKAQLAPALKVLEAHLAGRTYVAGGALAAADVLVAGIAGWARLLGLADPATYPSLAAYHTACVQRPAAKAARAD